MKRIGKTWWVGCVAVAALWLLGVGSVAAAESVAAVGTDASLWLLRMDREEGQVRLLHQSVTDDAATTGPQPAIALQGRLLSHGYAGHGRTLWQVYEGFVTQSVTAVAQPRSTRFAFSLQREVALPSTAAGLRAFAVSRSGPWALLRIEDAATLEKLDAEPAAGSRAKQNVDTKEKPDSDSETDTAADADKPAAPGAAASVLPDAVRADRLLHLSRGAWRRVPLPEAWPHEGVAHLVTLRDDDATPVLTVAPTDPDHADELWVFELAGDPFEPTWTWRRYEVKEAASARPVRLADQLALGIGRTTDAGLSVELSVLRPDAVRRLGVIEIPEKLRPQDWSLTPVGDAVAVLWPGSEQTFAARTINLLGRVSEVSALKPAPAQPLHVDADYMVIIVVLFISTLILFAFWKRDPQFNLLKLPRGMVICDLTVRLIAGVIDVVPGFVVVYLFFRLRPDEAIGQHWPGQLDGAGSWSGMVPGAVVIGVTILQTTILELLTARSLGKWLVRPHAQVSTMTGTPARVWQILLRNAMKVIELIAWPMLILIILSPHRQRLGDLIARTVVIMPEPEDADDAEGSGGSGGSDGDD